MTRNVWLFLVLPLWLVFSLRVKGDDSGQTRFSFCWAAHAWALTVIAFSCVWGWGGGWIFQWWLRLAHQCLCCREKTWRGWVGTLSLVWSIQVQSSRRGLSPAEVAQVKSYPLSWWRRNIAAIGNLDTKYHTFQKIYSWTYWCLKLNDKPKWCLSHFVMLAYGFAEKQIK